MNRTHISLLLAFTLVFVLGCSLFTGTPSVDVPTAAPQPANGEPDQQPTQAEAAPPNTPLLAPTTASAAQSGDLLFQSNFSDFDNWEVITNNDASIYKNDVRSNGLYVEVPEDYDFWYAYAVMEDNYDNVRMEADVELVGGTNYTYIALVCRSSDAGEYVFFLDTGGYWQIGAYDFGSDSPYENLADGASNDIKVAKNPNHMTAVCDGSTLTMFINGKRVGSVEDSRFTSGIIGIGVETFDLPLSQVMFYNLEVYVP